VQSFSQLTLPQLTLPQHGVLIHYLNTGVYLVGESGVGKSETALELLDSGAQLVCDDAPQFHIEDDKIIGTCPEQFYGLIHIRELGILDINRIKSEQHVTDRHSLDIVIELFKPYSVDFGSSIISPRLRNWYYDNIPIPGISLSCGETRNISLLVKTAILQYALR
jgi:HPr kinase/phosphorylase